MMSSVESRSSDGITAEIGRIVRPFPFSKGPASSTGTGLPSDLVREGHRRLEILVLIYATVYLITAFLLPDSSVEGIWEGRTADILSIFFIVTSVGLYLLIRSGRMSHKSVQSCAMAFEIYGAIGIEIGLLTWNGDPAAVPIGLSWVTVWIVSFPLFVPAPPRVIIWPSLLAASIRPVMFALIWASGIALPDIATLVQITAPNYLCVGIAVLASHVVYGLGRDVAAARQMGSYRLRERLGQGGMGEVWKAEHRMLARPAAIKLVRPDLTRDPEILERFEREVQSTAQLRSPHTIAVYDYGIGQDGVFYYVMELLDGFDLERLIRTTGALAPDRVIHILRQLCHSLGEAHQNGIIHRDVKPANIFLCRYGREVDFVKLLDFGLVKTEGLLTATPELTRADAFAGTPTYAAPEMARGDAVAVDARADIYSLGCVAFWLLAARPPFEADSAVEMLMKHAGESPQRLSAISPQPVPEALDRLVLECLAKEPADRCPSADALDTRLMEIQKSHPWPAARAREWWHRYRTETEPLAPRTVATEVVGEPSTQTGSPDESLEDLWISKWG
jgi:serine/threonine protein kinase